MTVRELFDFEVWFLGIACLIGTALIIGFRPGSPPWPLRAAHLSALAVFFLVRAETGPGHEWPSVGALTWLSVVTVALIVGLVRSVDRTERTRRQLDRGAVLREVRSVEREDRAVEREDRAVEREERAVERDREAIVRDDDAVLREENAVERDERGT